MKMQIFKNLIFTFIFFAIIFIGASFMSENPKDFLLQPFSRIFFLILFTITNIYLIPYQKAISRTGVLDNLEAIRKMPKIEYEQKRKLWMKKNTWIFHILLLVVCIGLFAIVYTLITKDLSGFWIVFVISGAVVPFVIVFSREITKKG
ncbi:MAG: hypothetical protein Q7S23_00770 [bacterium]|nr:hypothetical protein [bacterium]